MTSAILRYEEFSAGTAEPGTAAPRPDPAVDPAEMERALTRARSEAHARGYEEGAAAALAAQDAELKMLLSDLSDRLADDRMTLEEARAGLLRETAPLLRALVGALSPALAEAGLAREVAGRLDAILRHAPDAQVRIAVAPPLAPRLAETLGAMATVLPDPDCTGLAARLTWGSGFDEIDLGASMAAVAEAVDAFLALQAPDPGADTETSPMKEQHHG